MMRSASVELRTLSTDQIHEFAASLEAARNGHSALSGESPERRHLLGSAPATGLIVSLTAGPFRTRLQLGLELNRALGNVPQRVLDDPGLWAWLALLLFDVICPPGSLPGEDARYIWDGDWRRWYRHLLYGPFVVVRRHEEDTEALRVLLGNAPDTPGEIWEQIASHQFLLSCPPVIRAVALLYYDPERGSAKAGAASKGDAPGSIRRFVTVLSQFDCTYDLWKTPAEKLVAMLPDEFDRFRR